MQQIASMDFTIDVVSTTTFHLTYLDASGFAADASAGFVERVNDWMFYPRWRYITAMSAVAPSSTLVRVKLSVTHNFTVGQLISFRIPAVWGKSANAAYDTQYAIIEAVNAAGIT